MSEYNKLIKESIQQLDEDMYGDRVIHIDLNTRRGEMIFKPDDLDPELQEGGYYGPPIISGFGVNVYIGESDMWIIPEGKHL